MNNRPQGMLGLHHVALFVPDEFMQACLDFYIELMGMQLEWQPDNDNFYLSNGNDNLALHRVLDTPSGFQRLDHIGFVLKSPEAVLAWHDYFVENKVKILRAYKQHRDGGHSFYCADPAGTMLELIYHPPIVKTF